MQTITATDSMNRAYRAHTDPRKPATFAKPGETQDKAIKRFMSGRRREWSYVEKRNYPAFASGMSTAEYVRRFESMNGGNGQKTAGFWQALNTEPATLYAGESFDFAPIVEDVDDDEPMAEPIPADLPMPAPVLAEPIADPAPVAPVVADPAPPIGEMAQDVDPIAWQIRAARPTTIYATPAYRIGVHEWCMVVYAHDIYAACTDHLWRRVDCNSGRFFTQREWPTYNSNDGTYGGLPKSIRRKVFDPNEAQIDRALADARAGILPAWAGDNIRSTLQQGIDARARQEESLQILREQREMVARVKAKAAAAAQPEPIAAEPAHVEPEPVACTPAPGVGEIGTVEPTMPMLTAASVIATNAAADADDLEPGQRAAALRRSADRIEANAPAAGDIPAIYRLAADMLRELADTVPLLVGEMRNEAPAVESAQIIVPAGWSGCAPDLSQNRPDARMADAGARSWVSGAGLGWRDAPRRAGSSGRRSALPPRWRGADAMRRPAARCGMAPAPPPAWGKCAPTANCNERRAS